MVFALLFDHRGLDRQLHSLCLAAGLRIADQSGDVRVRQSGGRGGYRIGFGWRSRRQAYTAGHGTDFGECGGDHDDEGEADEIYSERAVTRSCGLVMWHIRLGCEETWQACTGGPPVPHEKPRRYS